MCDVYLPNGFALNKVGRVHVIPIHFGNDDLVFFSFVFEKKNQKGEHPASLIECKGNQIGSQ